MTNPLRKEEPARARFAIDPDGSWSAFVNFVATFPDEAESVADRHLEAHDARIDDLDPRLLRVATWRLVEVLNEASGSGTSAREVADEYRQLEQLTGEVMGAEGVTLLDYLAAETSEYFLFPPRSWPSGPRDWLTAGIDALSSWSADYGRTPATTLVLAARLTHILERGVEASESLVVLDW